MRVRSRGTAEVFTPRTSCEIKPFQVFNFTRGDINQITATINRRAVVQYNITDIQKNQKKQEAPQFVQ